MAEGFKRGEVGSQVNSWMPSTNTVTPSGFTSSIAPFGLQLRQTINAGTTSVTIPAGITFVYAIAVGGGGGGSSGSGGGAASAGGVAWGWTLATSSCVVGTGGVSAAAGGYTRYGNVIAGGGNTCLLYTSPSPRD